MRGTVMKITENQIVVFCEDGTFRNLPRQAVMPRLGDNIPVPMADRPDATRNRRFKVSWLAGPAAAAVLLLLGIVFLLKFMTTGSTPPLTLVAIDINPSIELGVTSAGKVAEVRLVNDDAKSIVTKQQLMGKSFAAAVERIISEAERQGYLEAGTAKTWIWMTVVPPADSGAPAFAIDRSTLPISEKYTLELFTATTADIQKAVQSELSINKYIVYEQAASQGIQLDIAELRTHSIISVLKEAGITPKILLEQGSDDVGASPESREAAGTSGSKQKMTETPASANPDAKTHQGSESTPEIDRSLKGEVEKNTEAPAKLPNQPVTNQASKHQPSGNPPAGKSREPQGKAGSVSEEASKISPPGSDKPQNPVKDESSEVAGNKEQGSDNGTGAPEKGQGNGQGKVPTPVDASNGKAPGEGEEDIGTEPAAPAAAESNKPSETTEHPREEAKQPAASSGASPSPSPSTDPGPSGSGSGKGKP
ncbi:MAG: hypothetical protein E7E23_07355 [Paenibacillus sp.]|uniref:anti-sigma-I factor RsgI family protein n=1 Tax=Paenibacillus sp. TaxID=58172 RepID=UPI0029047AC8|nr:hypothetical protein [Paenibacillus sp.]MDU2240382.1 hypothetical protein [Paenibacillus sp.]